MANTMEDMASLIARMSRAIQGIPPDALARMPGPVQTDLGKVVQDAQPYIARGPNQPRRVMSDDPE